MLDFAWSELLVVIIVAILVIGPKDIPKVMQGLGRMTRRIHYLKFAMSRQFEDMMKEMELEDIKRQAQKSAAEFMEDTDEAAADEALLIEEGEVLHSADNDQLPSESKKDKSGKE